MLAIIFGPGVAVWQAQVALQEKQRAEEVKRFIAGVFRESDPYQRTGAKLSVEELLRDAHRRINHDLSARPEMQVELLEMVGASLANIQATEPAEAALNEAAVIGTRELGPNHSLTMRARVTRLEVLRFLGRGKELRRELDDLMPRLRTAGADPADLVVALQMQAHDAIDEARYEAAIVAAKESLDIGRRVLDAKDPQSAKAAIVLALAYEYLKQPELAQAAAEQALRLAQRAQDAGGSVTSTLIEARQVLGRALSALGEFGPGIEHLKRVVGDSIAHFGPDAIEVGFNLHNLGRSMAEAGDVKNVLESATAAEKIFARHARQGTYFYPYARASLAIASTEARRSEDVVPTLRAALHELESIVGSTHPIVRNVREGLALTLGYRGETEAARAAIADIRTDDRNKSTSWRTLRVRSIVERLDGNHALAAKLAREGLASHSGPRVELQRMQLLPVLGLALVELNESAEAIAVLAEAVGLLERFETTPSPTRAEVNVGLGRALLRNGAADKALVHLQHADAFWRDFDSQNRGAGEAAFWLSAALGETGSRSEAEAALARALPLLTRSPLERDRQLVRAAQRRAEQRR
jgi:tetratricopeptide (TPR) repeat protein